MIIDGSTRVVVAALVGNILVALSKFIAAALSGSSAMLTEAIHSAADSTNQVLLLIGDRRSKAPPDAVHNFGYGPEIYFWTFVVAVLVLLIGGGVSLIQGAYQITHPHRVESLPISLGVFAASFMFEGATFLIGQNAVGRSVRMHDRSQKRPSFWRYIRLSKDPNLYESQLEDGAALIGVFIGVAGVLCNGLLGWLWADGAASCAIGILLVVNALIILSATRSLVAGESVIPAFKEDIAAAIEDAEPAVRTFETLHLGPNCVLVALNLERSITDAEKTALSKLISSVRSVDHRIKHVLIRP